MKIVLSILFINFLLINANNDNSTNKLLEDILNDEDNVKDMMEDLEKIFKMIDEHFDEENGDQVFGEEELDDTIFYFEDEINDDLSFLEDIIENERENAWPQQPVRKYKLIV